MELNYKFYSSFFLIVISLLSGCNNENFNSGKYGNPENISELQLAYNFQVKAAALEKKEKLDSAFYFYNESKRLYLSQNDSLRGSFSALETARLYHTIGDYYECETIVTEVLPYLEATNNQAYLTTAYNLLGRTLSDLFNYDDALFYYNKAYTITNDSLAKCTLLNNKANIYVKQGKYTKAIEILEKLNTSSIVNKRNRNKAMVLNSMGIVLSEINDKRAEIFLIESLNVRRKLKDPVDLLSGYLALAEFYSRNGITNEANKYAKEGYILAKRINNGEDQLRALRLFIDNNNGNELKIYITEYITLNDSLGKVRMTSKNQFAKIKYDSKKAQEQSIKQIEKNKVQRRWFLIITFFIILFSILIYIILKLKHKREKLKEVYKTENRLSKRIHDELANDVFNVLSFAETLDVDKQNKEKLIQGLDTVYGKTRDISHENSEIETGLNYTAFLLDMFGSYKSNDLNVIVVNLNKEDWEKIDELKKIAIYRVLQELMVNLKKHSGASQVVIKFLKENHKMIISYNDNGVGFGENKVIYSNGLDNAGNRIIAIDGNITFDSIANKGLNIRITFPI